MRWRTRIQDHDRSISLLTFVATALLLQSISGVSGADSLSRTASAAVHSHVLSSTSARSARSASETSAPAVPEGSGNGVGTIEALSGTEVGNDETDAEDLFVMELLSAVEFHLDGDLGSKGQGSVSAVDLGDSEHLSDEQLIEEEEAKSGSSSTIVMNTSTESTKSSDAREEDETTSSTRPPEGTTTGSKPSTPASTTSGTPDTTTTTPAVDTTTETASTPAVQELPTEPQSTVATSEPQVTEPEPLTTESVPTETAATGRSSETTPWSDGTTVTAGPTESDDVTDTTVPEDLTTAEDVSSWRSAGLTTGLTTPLDEQEGDVTPPWTPEPSFEQPTGRPLRKSSRRGDPDIHTVLNNILSIIGGNVRVRGQPAPSLRPQAEGGNNRINNRGPPQFVAGPGAASLVGGLPPTQVAPPPRTKTTKERIRTTPAAGLNTELPEGATVSPTPVLTSSSVVLTTTNRPEVTQTSVSVPTPTPVVTQDPSSAVSEVESSSKETVTTVDSPTPTDSASKETTTGADATTPSVSLTTGTSPDTTTVDPGSTVTQVDSGDSETTLPATTRVNTPLPTAPSTQTTETETESTNPASETTATFSETTVDSSQTTVASSETTNPTSEPALPISKTADPTSQPTDPPTTAALTSLSDLLGTSADVDTSAPEEEAPTRPFIPSRPASPPSAPLTSRPRRPQRPASSSRPASLFERLRESMRPTAASTFSPSQRWTPPPSAPSGGTTTGVSETDDVTTGIDDLTGGSAASGTSGGSEDLLGEDSKSTLSVGTEGPQTTQMEVVTTAPWEITTESSPATTEETTAGSSDSSTVEGTELTQQAPTSSESQPPTRAPPYLDATTAASADTSPPPRPASLGVGTAVAVSAEELVRPAAPPSRWPNGRPGMTNKPRPPAPTPPLAAAGRPGLVLDADAPHRPSGARPSKRRPEPTILTAPTRPVGDVIDVTVSAVQELGGGPTPPLSSGRQPTGRPGEQVTQPSASTGQPYVIPVDINELRQPGGIITQPSPSDNFVSIDGRRTYFNLEPTDINRRGSYQTVGAGVGFAGQAVPQPPGSAPSNWRNRPSTAGPPSGPADRNSDRLVTRPGGRPGQKTGSPYPGQRRRPSPPPVRIDTCIVGDDSTCKKEFNERCLTEDGVSSCVCRPGYSRLRPRTVCKRVVSVVMSVKVDGVDGQRLSWDSDFSDPQTEAFQQLAWDARNAINSAMTQTTMKDIYMGNAVNSFYSLGGRLILNTTVSLLDTPQTRLRQVKTELQRQMLRVIKAKDNNIGDSTLFVEGPLNPIPGVQDLNECSAPELHDCDENAVCSNVFGTFLCRCQPGFDDRYRSDVARAGRVCASCSDDYCGGHGTCQITNGVKTCLCRGSYYGARCDIDGEVLGAALGATAAAALVIIATFIGLCQWSKRWHKGRGRSKLEMGTMGAANTFNFVKPGPGGAQPAYALGMDNSLQWGRPADSLGHQNIYAPEPMLGGPPTLRSQMAPFGSREQPLYGSQVPLYGPKPTGMDGPASLNVTAAGRTSYPAHIRRARTPGALSERAAPSRGSRTPVPLPDYDDDDDDRVERQSMARGHPPVPRPRSRGSVANQSLVYYDIHDFEQRETLRGPGRGPPPMSTYSSRTSNYFR